MADRAFLERLTKQLANEGKLVEAGWVALRLNCISDKAPAIQLQEMRLAYMAGAQHMFASLIGIMDEDRKPTADDMKRMELIANELKGYEQELALWVAKTKGQA
jgi:hypothetical protein